MLKEVGLTVRTDVSFAPIIAELLTQTCISGLGANSSGSGLVKSRFWGSRIIDDLNVPTDVYNIWSAEE